MKENMNNSKEKPFGSFFIIPKSLLSEPEYSSLSPESVLLYGLMLDRTGLSRMNGKTCENGRPYIYFTVTEVMDRLGCASQKAVKTIRELEGAGLVEKLKAPKGKAAKFLVNEPKEWRISKDCKSENHNRTLADFKNEPFRKSKGNNTDNNTYFSNTLFTDEEVIRTNIEYDYLITVENKDEVDNIVAIICDTMSSCVKNVHIGECVYPLETVKKRLLQLNEAHISYVLDTLSRNRTQIRDIRSYVLKLLFNAPATMSLYYSARVAADFAE